MRRSLGTVVSAGRLALVVCCLALMASACRAQDVRELYRIRIVNALGGPIEVSSDQGNTYAQVGTVLQPATTSTEGYLASRYAVPGRVAATAVHGIRIKVSGPKDCAFEQSRVISIIPREFTVPPPDFGGYVSGPSGIYTDIPTGTAIFRNLSPFVGNPVFLETASGLVPMQDGYVPQLRDVLVIVVEIPVRYPSEILIDNVARGHVEVRYPDNSTEIVAGVEKPVTGVGRFDATGYTGIGRINTNHTGVLTISTSPAEGGEGSAGESETRGGFMILPCRHATSIWHDPQILIVGPCTPNDPWLEGMPPLFSGYIGLASDTSEEHSFRVDIQTTTSDWMPLPKLIGKQDNALMNLPDGKGALTRIRIRFPVFTEDWIVAESDQSERSYFEAKRQEAQRSGTLVTSGDVVVQFPGGNVDGADFVLLHIDGEFRGVSNNPPYTFSFDASKFSDGQHMAELTAVNSSGVAFKTSTMEFFIDNIHAARSNSAASMHASRPASFGRAHAEAG